jgi:hypothetical protein
MKIRPNSRLFCLLIIALVTMGAMQAQAIIVICRPIGIVAGQTARVTAANTGTRAIIIDWRILDSNGAVLSRIERQIIEPGKMISLDFNADNVVREGQRIQIRVDVGSNSKDIVSSLEIFDNATGKTTVALGGPDT